MDLQLIRWIDNMADMKDFILEGWTLFPRSGTIVKADHPITPLNPTPTFAVFDIKYERGSIFVRGEKTMWFHLNMIKAAV